MIENRNRKDDITINEDKIFSKLEGYFPSTVGVNGKMLRPYVRVKYNKDYNCYDVSFCYREE